MTKTYYARTYNDAIEDVLVVLRSEFGFSETTPLYKSIRQLKK
jgi:hypothetical protein